MAMFLKKSREECHIILLQWVKYESKLFVLVLDFLGGGGFLRFRGFLWFQNSILHVSGDKKFMTRGRIIFLGAGRTGRHRRQSVLSKKKTSIIYMRNVGCSRRSGCFRCPSCRVRHSGSWHFRTKQHQNDG